MPRRGENIYKRKDGRWEGRYIRGRTPAGKAEYGYVYAKSYAACREKRRRMEDALPQKPMLTGEMSVCQAAEFFLSERRGALKASTIGRYEYMIRHYIVPEIGTILLRDLTAEKLSVFFSRLQDRGLSCKSTRDVGVLLKTIFKVVKKKCHCDCPGRDVELPAYRSKKVEVFADHEIAALAQKVLDAPDITGLCVLLGKLEQVRNNIITRYRSEANDDWEWMDLGFYEDRPENYNTSEHPFDIAAKLAKLDTTTNVAMTEFDRTIMMLTARGFDCTKLSQYNNGEPYIDSKNNEIDNLVAALYNYSGEYTINGPIFALLALDMGNYTIPDNARWTRENLINVILDYGNYDEFGIDMVGAIMYSLAPYQNDAAYGAQIKEKLNLCLEIILRKMNSDFSFGAWGATNSESAAWVMMGLCSMGIDWNADPRFSDGQGHSALQHWMDNFVNVNGGYFHHTTSVTNDAMATYQGCYATMWYLKFLEKGQGTPCYFYYHRFDFARELSTDASITDFEIEGKKGVITEGGEGGENTITVTVPNGMPLTNLTPKVTMAEGATLLAPSLPTTFVEGVKQPFTVLAEDGKTTKTYYVTVNHGDVGASGAELDASSIKLKNGVLNVMDILEKKVTKASDGATEILLTVRAGVDTSKMYLSASISYAATVDPSLDGKDAMNFSNWQTFTVTSGDKTVQNTYRIKVVSKAQAEITSFRVQAVGEWYNGVIDNAKSTITVTGVDDSKLTSTKLVTDIEFTGKTCSPTSGIAVDFANAVTFTLGGDNDLASRTYTVTVLNKSGQQISAKSSGGDDDTPITSTAKITGFSVLGVEGEIDQSAGTITVKLPVGTNVTAVAPVVTVPAGAVVSPVSGEVVNLSNQSIYTVTLGTESRNYTVTVIFERSISQQLWDKVAENSDVADHQTSYGHRFN